MGFKSLIRGFRRRRNSTTAEYDDVHNRLMARYPEGKVVQPSIAGYGELIRCFGAGSPGMVVSRSSHHRHRVWHWRDCRVGDVHLPGRRLLWSLAMRNICGANRHRHGHYRHASNPQCAGRVHRWLFCSGQRLSHELLQGVRVSREVVLPQLTSVISDIDYPDT